MISQLKIHLCILCIILQCISFSDSFTITPSLHSRILTRKSISTFAASEVAGSSRSRFTSEGTYYCQCGHCKSAYVLAKTLVEKEKGSRVKCSVCMKEWYQAFDRLPMTSKTVYLTELSEDKIKDVKRIISETNVPKYPRLDRYEIFVGSIPFSYTDSNLAELFAEYGIINSYIVKDQQQNSRGFGFVELSTLEDAQKAIEEMSEFSVENRKLTVKMGDDGRRKSGPNQRNPSPTPNNSM